MKCDWYAFSTWARTDPSTAVELNAAERREEARRIMGVERKHGALAVSSNGAGADESVELTADAILGADDRVLERCEAPEWGGHFFVRAMTSQERDAWEDSLIEFQGKKRILKQKRVKASFFQRIACNSRGERLFTATQIEALGRKNAAPIERGCKIGFRLAGMTDEEVEKIEGNSTTADGEEDSIV